MVKFNVSSEIVRVTQRIAQRSAATRQAYVAQVQAAQRQPRLRSNLGCANMAHVTAALPVNDKLAVRQAKLPHVGLVTAYNDMLSAHQPYAAYPEAIKTAARQAGATAQVAGGVPAMCDGITQGEAGMELSLFSRDVIALSTAVALSHNVFDAVLCLGVCDKIVPGLLMGALQFGHLPTAFVPAGPMRSGLPNAEKSHLRQQHAQGLIDDEALMQAEMKSYHSAGTCTFYGTANSNQMLMEIMGLHLPGASFEAPNSPLRHALTAEAVMHVVGLASQPDLALGLMLTEKSWVNALVGLLATGGSTNHTLHLVAMARAAGVLLTWDDFADLSAVVPLLARIYPNGQADVNQFHAAGGMAFLIQELLGAGLLHPDVHTLMGANSLAAYTQVPRLTEQGGVQWVDRPHAQSGDETVLRPASQPFAPDGGLRLLTGNLGRSVVKVSAVAAAHRVVCAPAVVVADQHELLALYQAGQLNRDFVAVVRYQGPKANGMPELHKLTPMLGALQSQGFKVGLVTDGRMSGASGQVPAAIHLVPEALDGGPIARIQNGDRVLIDCNAGVLSLQAADNEWLNRPLVRPDLSANSQGCGRNLFGLFRQHVGGAEQGASPLWGEGQV